MALSAGLKLISNVVFRFTFYVSSNQSSKSIELFKKIIYEIITLSLNLSLYLIKFPVRYLPLINI